MVLLPGLLLLCLVISTVLSSPTNPKMNIRQPKSCRLSSSTQTFLLRDLKYFPVPVEYFRISPEILKSVMASIINAANPSSNVSAPPINTEQYELSRNELFACAWDKIDYLVEEVLIELYNEYPDIEHINQLKHDHSSDSSFSLLHIAVKTCNKNLIDFFKRNYLTVIDYNVKDSYGLSPAELADLEGSNEIFKQLIETFPSIIFEAFMGQTSLIHYAALKNRTALINFINQLNVYDFKKIYHNSWDILTPLELALKEQSFQVAGLLIRFAASIRLEILQIIYINFMGNLGVNNIPILFLLSHFPATLLHFKNQEGLDVMDLSVKRENEFMIKDLIDLGYYNS